MTIIVLTVMFAVCEAICATFISIKNAIERRIKREKSRQEIRRIRRGPKVDFKTRVRYKLESIYDEIVTPH